MKTKKSVSTAHHFHRMCCELWPSLRGGFVIDVGSTDFLDGCAGYCFHPLDDENPDILANYRASLGAHHPVRPMLSPIGRIPTIDEELGLVIEHVLVIDAEEHPDWLQAARTCLHEFAHAVRYELAGVYPTPAQLMKLSRYLEGKANQACHTGDTEEQRAIADLSLSIDIEQGLNELVQSMFPDQSRDVRPLFGVWATRTIQHDAAHDLLFYLVLHLLERKAADLGWLRRKLPVAPSVYVPRLGEVAK